MSMLKLIIAALGLFVSAQTVSMAIEKHNDANETHVLRESSEIVLRDVAVLRDGGSIRFHFATNEKADLWVQLVSRASSRFYTQGQVVRIAFNAKLKSPVTVVSGSVDEAHLIHLLAKFEKALKENSADRNRISMLRMMIEDRSLPEQPIAFWVE